LALDIDERYQSAADLGRDLDDLERALQTTNTGLSELFHRGLTRVAVGVVAVPLVLGILGLISTGIFNLTLGRRGFESEPFSATFVWGARSIVGPTILIVILVTATWLVTSIVQAARVFTPIERLVCRIARWP